MKKLSEIPKTRLTIWIAFAVLFLSITIFIVMTEFVYPHDLTEPLLERIIYFLYIQHLNPIVFCFLIANIRELKGKETLFSW